MRAYLGLGANLDEPAETFRRAVERLDRPHTTVVRCAPNYGSRPMGPEDQPPYLNTVIEVDTVLSPLALLAELKATERRLGRTPTTIRWGPRVIDLDVLVYGDVRRASALLTLPHPGLASRRFVLAPLAALAPDLVIPGYERTVSALLDALTDDPDGVWLDTTSVPRGSCAP